MCTSDASTEVNSLASRGANVALTKVDDQCFVRTQTAAPSPPWDRSSYEILIPIPAAYADASLDAFYLELPYTVNGTSHPRVSGGVIALDGKQWQLVSWHYPDAQPWTRGVDTIESHIAHCGGFFLNRGAVNAIN